MAGFGMLLSFIVAALSVNNVAVLAMPSRLLAIDQHRATVEHVGRLLAG